MYWVVSACLLFKLRTGGKKAGMIRLSRDVFPFNILDFLFFLFGISFHVDESFLNLDKLVYCFVSSVFVLFIYFCACFGHEKGKYLYAFLYYFVVRQLLLMILLAEVVISTQICIYFHVRRQLNILTTFFYPETIKKVDIP